MTSTTTSGGTSTEGTTTFEVRGERIELPMPVTATTGLALVPADAAAIRARLPAGLAPVTWRPGRGLVVLVAVRYHDNPLGTYDEVVVASVARPAGTVGVASVREALTGGAGVFVHEMPVTQDFTCEAGRAIWGFPKTVDDLRWVAGPKRAGVAWRRDGAEVLRFSVPRGGRRETPWSSGTTFTERDGAVLRTELSMRASGVRMGPGGARITPGPGPTGAVLRDLGASSRALVTTWMEHVEMRFDAPTPL